MTVPKLVIYGASGHSLAVGSHAAWAYTDSPLYEVVAYIDDFRGDQGETLDGRPVIRFETWQRDYRDVAAFVAVGDPQAKRKLVARIAGAGGHFGTIHRLERGISRDCVVGEGSIVFTPNFVSSRCVIGAHVQLMPSSSLGHDIVIGDYCSVCPSVTISGHVNIEAGVFVGAGAVIVHGSSSRPLTIGEGATVGAGAVVTKSVPRGVTVFGNPARPLRQLARRRRQA